MWNIFSHLKIFGSGSLLTLKDQCFMLLKNNPEKERGWESYTLIMGCHLQDMWPRHQVRSHEATSSVQSRYSSSSTLRTRAMEAQTWAELLRLMWPIYAEPAPGLTPSRLQEEGSLQDAPCHCSEEEPWLQCLLGAPDLRQCFSSKQVSRVTWEPERREWMHC